MGKNKGIFDLFLEVNSYEQPRDNESTDLTNEDIETIRQLSERPDILEIISSSIGTSIHGHVMIKMAIALQLVGGMRIEQKDGTVNRGDIHILLIGDPGTGKTKLLESTSAIAPKSIRCSGKTASAVGLTAATVKDMDGSWRIEPGALVLADGGIAIIDELDKMSDYDRSAMHDGMESQTVTISKAGRNLTLPTRCSILAAANPIDSVFNLSKPIPEQINLPQSLLSRFDFIFAIFNGFDEDRDKDICDHIAKQYLPESRFETDRDATTSECGENSDVDATGQIKPDMLKKYIAYARSFTPELTQEAIDILMDCFINEKRFEAEVTTRQFIGLIRTATASAKLHLKDKVTAEDANVAIDLLNYSKQTLANHDCHGTNEGFIARKNDNSKAIDSIIQLFTESSGAKLSFKQITESLEIQGYDKQKIKMAITEMEIGGKLYIKNGMCMLKKHNC